MKLRYVRSLPEQVANLEAAFVDGNTDRLRNSAHQISGVAASYGFPQLGEAAWRLERAVEERERLSVLGRLVDDIARIVEAATADDPDGAAGFRDRPSPVE